MLQLGQISLIKLEKIQIRHYLLKYKKYIYSEPSLFDIF